MKKIIFLDVDGTLVDMQQNMLQSAKDAINEAKKNGHYVVICTGRMKSGIYPWLLDIGFDGIVASAGANVYWKGEEIYSACLSKKDLSKVAKVLTKHNAIFAFQGDKGRFMDSDNKTKIEEYFTSRGMEDIINQFPKNIYENPEDCESIESGIYMNCDVDIDTIQKEIGSGLKITGASFGEERIKNGEFTKMGITKATGMKMIVEHIGLTRDKVIAFGDGLNDIEMIEYANTGVVMGNAVDELKEIADMVTTSIDDDGVYTGFKKLNLI